MHAAAGQRWTHTQPSPLGAVTSTWELTRDGLRFETDAPLGDGAAELRWDTVAEAATAVLELPGGPRKGVPQHVGWMPGRMEWLLVTPTDRAARAIMRPLPDAEVRDAIVAALRERLGARWVGEGLPLEDAKKRFRIGGGSETLKVWGIVASVLATLVGLLLVVGLLAHPVISFPAGFAFGAWWFRNGLQGLRDGLRIANTPTAKVSSAAMGLVELEGRAVTAAPSPAGVSGTPSVWWDVAIEAWHADSDHRGGEWRQVAARHGGRMDTLVLEDATGRVPIWMRDADVILGAQTWESGKAALPTPGRALLEDAGFAWDAGGRLRVRETRMPAGGTLYVLGTLSEARDLPAAGDERGLAGAMRALRTGAWKKTLVAHLPGPLRATAAVTIAFLGMLTGVGRGGERTTGVSALPPPVLEPASVLVWKGGAGRPFVVTDGAENEALARLRTRSLWRAGLGGAVMCWILYELLKLI